MESSYCKVKSDEDILVSVIITCFNNSESIRETISSVLGQSHNRLQIIVVDDCSTDNSLSIVNSFNDDRIQVVSLGRNGGVANARNVGYELASGIYITQIDGDDTFHPDKIRNEVRACLRNPGCIVTSTQLVKYAGSTRRKWLFAPIAVNTLSRSGLLYRMEQCQRDWMIPSYLLDGIKYDASRNLYEDWDFMLALSSKASVIVLPSVGTVYYRHSKGLSARPWIAHHAALTQVFERHCGSRLAVLVIYAIWRTRISYLIFTLLVSRLKLCRFFPT